jgi:hypothetical protein
MSATRAGPVGQVYAALSTTSVGPSASPPPSDNSQSAGASVCPSSVSVTPPGATRAIESTTVGALAGLPAAGAAAPAAAAAPRVCST